VSNIYPIAFPVAWPPLYGWVRMFGVGCLTRPDISSIEGIIRRALLSFLFDGQTYKGSQRLPDARPSYNSHSMSSAAWRYLVVESKGIAHSPASSKVWLWRWFCNLILEYDSCLDHLSLTDAVAIREAYERGRRSERSYLLPHHKQWTNKQMMGHQRQRAARLYAQDWKS
jgi:hypothetical protein